MLCSTAACSGGRAMKEVVVYTSVDQPRSEPVFKAFEAETGIRVKAVYDVEASKTTGLANRLAAETGHPRADVFWSSEVIQTVALAEKGVFSPWSSAATRSAPAVLRDQGGRWTGLCPRERVILVNTDLVKPEEAPATIFDLVDGRWRADEVGMALPLFGTSFTQAVVLFDALGEERAAAFYEKAKAAGVRILDGNARVAALVADGTLKAGITDSDDAAVVLGKGAPVKVIVPDGLEAGGLLIPGTAALVRGAPHPVEGGKLIDYLLSTEVGKKLAASGYCCCSREEALNNVPGSWTALAKDVPSIREQMRKIFLR